MRVSIAKFGLLSVSGLALTLAYQASQAMVTCSGSPPSGFGSYVSGKFVDQWSNTFSTSSSGCLCTAVSENNTANGGQDFILYNTCAQPVNLSSQATSIGLYYAASSAVQTVTQPSGTPNFGWTIQSTSSNSTVLLPSKFDDSLSLANGQSIQVHVEPKAGDKAIGGITQLRPTTAPAFTNWDGSHSTPQCLQTAYQPSYDKNDTFVAIRNTCGSPQTLTNPNTYINVNTETAFGSIDNIFTPYLPASEASNPFSWIADPDQTHPNYLVPTATGDNVQLDSADNHNTLILNLENLSDVEGAVINAPQGDSGWVQNPCLQVLYQANNKITQYYTRAEPSFTVTNVCADPIDLFNGLRVNLLNDVDPSTGRSNILFEVAQNENGFSGNFSQIGSYPATQKIECSAPTGASGKQTCPSTATEYALITNFGQWHHPVLEPGKSFNFSLYAFDGKRAPTQIYAEPTTQQSAVPTDLQTATVNNAAFPGEGVPSNNPGAFLQKGTSTLYNFMPAWASSIKIPLAPLYESSSNVSSTLADDFRMVFWDYKNVDSKGQILYYGSYTTAVTSGGVFNIKFVPLKADVKFTVKTVTNVGDLDSAEGPSITLANANQGSTQILTHQFKLSETYDYSGLLEKRIFSMSPSYGSYAAYPRASTGKYYDCNPKPVPAPNVNPQRTPSVTINYSCAIHPTAPVEISTDLSVKQAFPIEIVDITHPQVAPRIVNSGSTKSVVANLRVDDQYAVGQIRVADSNGNVYKGTAAPITVQSGSSNKMLIHFTPVKTQYTPFTDITTLKPGPSKTQTFAFLTALNGQCSPGWAMVPYDSTGDSAPLPAIQKYVAAGNSYYLSLGGQSGQLLMQACTDPNALLEQYNDIYKLYNKNMLGFDFDIEGGNLMDTDSIQRGAAALAKFQQMHPDVDIWLTLPAMPTGLTDDGVDAVHIFHQAGVVLAGVNIMAMDYGSKAAYPGDMAGYAKQAATALFGQLKAEYKGEPDALIWSMVGVTPMIGYNDTGLLFSLDDSNQLVADLKSDNIGRMAMWSTGRDHACSQQGEVTYTCSGLTDQTDNEFGDNLQKIADN